MTASSAWMSIIRSLAVLKSFCLLEDSKHSGHLQLSRKKLKGNLEAVPSLHATFKHLSSKP
jgi:hypothetical protein